MAGEGLVRGTAQPAWSGLHCASRLYPALGSERSHIAQYWRRRRFQLKGQQLLAISEVTKEVKMALDLSHCVAVEDLNAPIVPVPSSGASSVSGATSAATASTSATDEDEVLTSLDHSFRLTMQDGTTVSFYADDDEAKKKWVTQLERIRGRGAPIAKWIIAMRKLLGPSATTATVMSSSDSMMQPPTLPSKQGRIQPPRTRSAVM